MGIEQNARKRSFHNTVLLIKLCFFLPFRKTLWHWAWFVEKITAYGNGLRSTPGREFPYLKLCRLFTSLELINYFELIVILKVCLARPLRQRSPKFQRAKWFCHLCEYHCDNLAKVGNIFTETHQFDPKIVQHDERYKCSSWKRLRRLGTDSLLRKNNRLIFMENISKVQTLKPDWIEKKRIKRLPLMDLIKFLYNIL